MIEEASSPTNHSWPIYGHTSAVNLLHRAVGTGRGPRHAYLFVGTRHVGKTTLAQTFARALLCTHQQHQPCHECRSCRLMQSGTHSDFRVIQPLDKQGNIDRSSGSLRAEQATELVRESVLSPIEGRYKIFLIQDMHTANSSFANKILKTLEEPPDHVILCASASDRSQLLPTIVSRCQVVELQLLSAETIAKALVAEWQAEDTQAQLLSKLAGGRLGWAVEHLSGQAGSQKRIEQLQILWELARSNRLQRLAFADKLSSKNNSREVFEMLELWTTWWRDILLTQAGCIDACSNIDYLNEIEKQSQNISLPSVQQYMHTLHKTERYLQHTTNTRLALEVLLLQLPQLS